MPLSIISNDNYELLVHPYLFPTGQFCYTYQRGISLRPSKCFNQGRLNYMFFLGNTFSKAGSMFLKIYSI